MRITGIRRQQRSPERVNVFIDGAFACSISINQLLEFGLKINQEINQIQLEDLQQASREGKVVSRVQSWVLLRPRSMHETFRYVLRVLGSQDQVAKNRAQELVENYRARGWLDDEVFARWWVERPSRASRSHTVLRAELRDKGVSDEIIGKVLTGDDMEALSELLARLISKPKYSDRAKLMRYLAGKGFRYSSVKEALAAVDNEA